MEEANWVEGGQQVPKAPEHDKIKEGAKKAISWIWEFAKIIIVAIVIVLPIRYFLFQPFIVKGTSMVPNFQDGNYLIIDEISYRFVQPHRGEVVVLKYPLDENQRFIKRIIGLPGETVEVKNGKVQLFKDGKALLLDETKYLPGPVFTDGDVQITLGKDQYFVMGDNRQFSYDSRRWGALPKEDIVGRVVLRVFPTIDASYLTKSNY